MEHRKGPLSHRFLPLWRYLAPHSRFVIRPGYVELGVITGLILWDLP